MLSADTSYRIKEKERSIGERVAGESPTAIKWIASAWRNCPTAASCCMEKTFDVAKIKLKLAFSMFNWTSVQKYASKKSETPYFSRKKICAKIYLVRNSDRELQIYIRTNYIIVRYRIEKNCKGII